MPKRFFGTVVVGSGGVAMAVYIKEPQNRDDIHFLWDMLYEAAAVSESIRLMGRDKSLALPEISKYLAHWGRNGDYALIAYDATSGQYLGAAWYRLFTANGRGYGYIADTVPEISMAVIRKARGRGIGTLLLKGLIDHAMQENYPALSLSVSKDNRAKQLYEKMGFVDAGVSTAEDSSITLKLVLDEQIPVV